MPAALYSPSLAPLWPSFVSGQHYCYCCVCVYMVLAKIRGAHPTPNTEASVVLDNLFVIYSFKTRLRTEWCTQILTEMWPWLKLKKKIKSWVGIVNATFVFLNLILCKAYLAIIWLHIQKTEISSLCVTFCVCILSLFLCVCALTVLCFKLLI